MPNSAERKEHSTSKERIEKKYVLVDKERHPFRLYPCQREKTETLRRLMDDKTYIRVMTEIGLNKYIIAQYYIYCDDDLWMSGESMVFNCNPDKKILVQPMCIKTRKECACHDESSHEFLTICPKCRNIIVAIHNTEINCKHCKTYIPSERVNDMPFIKTECEFCPVEMGWEQVLELNKNNPKFYLSKMVIRSHMIPKIIDKEIEAIK